MKCFQMKCCLLDQVHAESVIVMRQLLEGYQVMSYVYAHLAFMNNQGHIKLAIFNGV